MDTLKRSHDRKVTNLVNNKGNGSLIANAFGLPAGKAYSCPGATSVCSNVCYAGKLEKVYSNVMNVMLHNWNLLKDATFNEQYELLSEMIDAFRADCVKRNAELKFRIHWDGDFFSLQYAYAWAKVVDNNPDITFWVYTRTFNVVEAFVGLDNISVYLSTDTDNVREATATKKAFPYVNYATLADTYEIARDMVSDPGRSYDCPELSGRIPLIDNRGSACNRCGVCVVGRGTVVFSISKK